MSNYSPDKWEIIGKTRKDGSMFFKVFGSWTGGYLDGDNWRLSSGLKKVETDPEDEKIWLMHNHSGSIYRCHKDMKGVAGAYNMGQLSSLLEKDSTVELYSVDEFNELYKDEE